MAKRRTDDLIPSHPAKTEVLVTARIEEASVPGIIAALALKSDIGHTHPASDIVSGVLALARIPAHASTHQAGGSDGIKLDDLVAPDDNTDLNASALSHGLLPKLPGNAEAFLRGDGVWAGVPSVQGRTGPAGKPGTQFRSGSCAPDPKLGIDNDYYLNQSTGDLLTKQKSKYVKVMTFAVSSSRSSKASTTLHHRLIG